MIEEFATGWEWARGYYTAISHVAAHSDWAAPAVQFVTTLMAGGISIYVAHKTVAWQERNAARKAAADEQAARERLATEARSKAGDAVMTAMHKLIDCGEILGNTRKDIDEQFITAAEYGYASEPFQIMRPSEGRDYEPQRVEHSEIAFLLKHDELLLMRQIALVYRRTINAQYLLQTYSQECVKFHEWIQNLPGHKGKLLGEIASDAIPFTHASAYDRKAGNLNRLIVAVVDQVNDTLVLLQQVLGRLAIVSKAEFGQDFKVIVAEFDKGRTATLEEIRNATHAAGRRFDL